MPRARISFELQQSNKSSPRWRKRKPHRPFPRPANVGEKGLRSRRAFPDPRPIRAVDRHFGCELSGKIEEVAANRVGDPCHFLHSAKIDEDPLAWLLRVVGPAGLEPAVVDFGRVAICLMSKQLAESDCFSAHDLERSPENTLRCALRNSIEGRIAGGC